MRKRDDIKILDNLLQEDKDNASESTVFPAAPAKHDHFFCVLNEVVRANFKENTSRFGGLVGRVEYHEYDYRFYVEIKYSPYSVYESFVDTIDFPEWIENIGATFSTIVWLDRGGSVTDFIKSIELRLKHLEQAGALFNQAVIRESTEDAVFKEAK